MPFSCTKRTFSADDPDGVRLVSFRDAVRADRVVLPAKPMLWKIGMGIVSGLVLHMR